MTTLVSAAKHEGVMVRMDAGVHVLLLTGAGEKFFCAGADIKMLEGADPYFKNDGAL